MFQGTLPANAMKAVGNIIKDWDCERIVVGCSGNFTIERAISNFDNVKAITSNDVTIYSGYLGKYFAGEELEELVVKDEYEGHCQWFRDYMNTPLEKIATLILASDVVAYDSDKLLYYKRMRDAYEEQWPELHKVMCEKIEKMKLKVDSFYYGDVMELIDSLDDTTGFVSFPPFFKGGYEKMWQGLEKVFTYEPPDYVEFDPKVHIEEFCRKAKGSANFAICTEREVEELKEFYSGMVLTSKGKPIYIYSKSNRKIFIKPTSKSSVLKLERIGKDDSINNVEIKQLTHEQFDEIRAVYLSKKVTRLARETAAYGLFTDNKLFGVFAFSSSMTLVNSFQNMIEGPTIYLMTDFAVSPTKEKHLSKLVLMCALSKEAKLLAEGIMYKRVRSVCTNAFSKNPVSMKYRGLFEQLGRKEVDKDKDGNVTKYNLTYGAMMGKWTLQEAFDKWKQK